MSGLILAVIFIFDIENTHIYLLATVFTISSVIFLFSMNSVTLLENGLQINTKVIAWESFQSINIDRNLIITTVNQEIHTISHHFDSFNQIVDHIKLARNDLFVAPLQTDFNDTFSNRISAVVLNTILLLIGVLPLLIESHLHVTLVLWLTFILIYLVFDTKSFHSSNVLLTNGLLQIRKFFTRNISRRFDEIIKIERSEKSGVEYLTISFSDGKEVEIPNFTKKGQYLYDNIEILRNS